MFLGPQRTQLRTEGVGARVVCVLVCALVAFGISLGGRVGGGVGAGDLV